MAEQKDINSKVMTAFLVVIDTSGRPFVTTDSVQDIPDFLFQLEARDPKPTMAQIRWACAEIASAIEGEEIADRSLNAQLKFAQQVSERQQVGQVQQMMKKQGGLHVPGM